MKILITGAAGFVGSNLANILSKDKNNEVVGLDDLSLGIQSNLSKEVKFVKGSVMDRELVLDLSKNTDYIFHDAAKSSSPMFRPDPKEGVDVNVMGFMNVMEAAKRNNIKKVVYASSSSIYSGLPMPFKESQQIIPKTFYEASFYCREVLARTYYLENKVKSIGLRYFSVYGPNERHKKTFANNITQMLWNILESKSPVFYGNGDQTRDFTYVDDIVRANILAMKSEKGFGIYNVGTGKSNSFNKVLELLNDRLGTDIKAEYIPNPVTNYVQDTLADISLTRSELGYEPEWDLERGINMIVSAYKK